MLINLEKMPAVFSFPEEGKNTAKYNGACIYLICSPRGKPYVGQAKKFRNRMVCHKSKGKQAWINHAKYQEGKRKNKVCAISFGIHEHGWENMEITILQKYSVWDQQLLDSCEIFFIRFYDSFKNGYNSNEGGNRCKSHPCSEETKAKLSAAHMGIGTKPVTSREIKEEYADGTQLVEFVSYLSAREAERKTRVAPSHIGACCLGKQNSAGNRFWHFTKEGDLVGEHRVDNIMGLSHDRTRGQSSQRLPDGEKQQHEGGQVRRGALCPKQRAKKKFESGRHYQMLQGRAQIPPRVHVLLSKVTRRNLTAKKHLQHPQHPQRGVKCFKDQLIISLICF